MSGGPLFIDDREKLIPEALTRYRDIEVSITRLDSADCRFEGNGEHGECLVGCERKRLSDLVNCIKDKRLAGSQLLGMVEEHDYAYVFVEGLWRPGPNGELEEWLPERKWPWRPAGWQALYSNHDRRSIMYRNVVNYLATLEMKGWELWERLGKKGELRWRRTADAKETAAQYAALYYWFQEDWEKHKSHDQVYSNQGNGGGRNGRRRKSGRVALAYRPPTELELMLMQLPGVDDKARAVAEHFGQSFRAIAMGTVRDWCQVAGIGQKTAEKCVEILRK